jgi:hypothetical protein
MKINEILTEGVAGPKNCWPGYRKTGTQPGTGKNKGKRVNDCEKIKEDDEIDESGLQYYTGVKKHGKEYMTKAAQAARDGASQKELGALKDKYSKAHKEDTAVEEAAKKGLYYYVNKRKKAGTSRPASSPNAPTAQAWKDAAKTAKKEGVAEGMFGIEDKIKGKIQNIVSDLSDIPGMWDHSAQTFTPTGLEKLKSVLKNNPKYIKYAVNLTADDYNADLSEQGVAEAGSPAQQAAIAINMKKHHKKPKNESLELAEEFDMIENIIEQIADQHAVDADLVWEDLSTLTDDELYVFAVTSEMVNEDWQKANKRDKTDGMSKKAVNAYRRENPGSKLKTAVTTKPSKLKKGSKASKRRSSYCSRSRGQMKMHSISCSKTPDKAICKARRRWNC